MAWLPGPAIFQPATVYPNPAKNKVTIDLSANSSNVQSIELVDFSGTVVVRANVGTQTTLNLAGERLKPGIYLLRFKGNEITAQRLVIQ